MTLMDTARELLHYPRTLTPSMHSCVCARHCEGSWFSMIIPAALTVGRHRPAPVKRAAPALAFNRVYNANNRGSPHDRADLWSLPYAIRARGGL
jgi:hypothetical protein